MVTLQTYVTDSQNLLHDQGQLWPVPELTGYINKARRKVAQDTKCLRQDALGLVLTGGQEIYQISSFVSIPAGLGPVIDIMGINIYWGTQRIALQYLSWSELNALLRIWQTRTQLPAAYARKGALQIYFGPVPDQNYTSDWDVAFHPADMVNLTDTEIMPAPFDQPVMWYTAYLAKAKEQALGEMKFFEGEYTKQVLQVVRAFQTRTIRDPYGR